MPGPRSLQAPVARLAASSLLLAGLLSSSLVHAQDEAFLRCADFTERNARVACLEDALAAAMNARDAARSRNAPATAANPPAAPAPQVTAPPSSPQSPQSPQSSPAAPATASAQASAPPAADTEAGNSRLRDVFGWFGRDRVEEGEEPPAIAESMQASVAELEFYKPDVLTITLDNGQVWRQLYAERYNLRKGDRVTITRATGRLQYRLEAERFNGFIRVERLR